MSFVLQMAMAPKVGLEVSPALVVFGELLTLPCASMQSVVERELSANAALERSGRRRLPDLPWHLAHPMPGVLGPARGGATTGSPTPATERRRSRTPRRCSARCGWRPAPPRPRSPSASSTASTSTACSTGRARTSPPTSASPNRRSRACWTLSAVAGRPASARFGVAECLLLQLDALELDDDRGSPAP